MTAYFNFQPLRYRIRMLGEEEVLPLTAYVLPLNTAVRVRELTKFPLTKRDIANHQRGFASYLPATDEQHIAHYDLLYGIKLSTPIAFAEVEECGVGVVVPIAVLALLCAELRVAARHAEQICQRIIEIPVTFIRTLTRSPDTRRESALLVKASEIIRRRREASNIGYFQPTRASALPTDKSPVKVRPGESVATTAKKRRRKHHEK